MTWWLLRIITNAGALAIGGSIVISIVGWLVGMVLPDDD